jgi:hypothetical protein
MLKSANVTMTVALLCGVFSGQSTTRPSFFDHARLQHDNSLVTVTAYDSLPLFQAIYAVRLEYGWAVNWESAPGYSHLDLVDDTGPKWRAAHPHAKGVTRPAGGLFIAMLPEPKESDPDSQRLVLARLIEQYNATDNPGRYALLSDAYGHFTVVGTKVRDETGALQKVAPLLDTLLILPKATRDVDATIESILTALQSASGKKVIFGSASRSLFRTTQVTMGGEEAPARELLQEALAGTKQAVEYDLFFNADAPVYILNVSPQLREEGDGLGGRKLVPVDRSPSNWR